MPLEQPDATIRWVLALVVGIVVLSVRFANLRLVTRAIGAPGTSK